MKRRTLLAGVALTAPAWRAAAQSDLGTQATPPAFTPAVQTPKLDDSVGAGYSRGVLARWGDAVLPDAPAFSPYPLTAAQADSQFPYDAVIAGFMTAPAAAQDGIPRLVAVFADPDAPARMVFPGSADIPVVAGKLQGATVVNLQYLSGQWLTVDGGYQSRRINDGTLCQITGPAAASIGSTVQGLLAPQAGCATPWGTVLFTEGDAAPWLTRLAATGYGFNDPTDAPRFGWVVELDPFDPGAFPIKRTALGRFARGGIAATTTPNGQPVIFFAQDDPAGMFFRFIGAAPASGGSALDSGMLDSGTLAVAQIQDSTITWVNLGGDSPSLIGALGVAAAAGGSAFDAPGGIAIATDGTGTLYLACAGNPARDVEGTNALNPRAGDDNGHVIAFHPPNGDLTAATFQGEIAIAAGNPVSAPFTQYAPGSTSWFTKPRTLNLDPAGQLWIGTDQGGVVSDTADGLFVMQTGGARKYVIPTAYLAPVGAAIGGAAFDPGTRTVFGMVRHPGATTGASFGAPATRWPTLMPDMPPQSTVITLTGG
jgi:secreted PhoX family phosphatase